MISYGIPPQYFLDEMSFDEIAALIKEKTEQDHQEWERQRWGWFYVLISQGSKAEKPQDIVRFPWEKTKETRKLSKSQVKKKVKQAEKWLNNRLT